MRSNIATDEKLLSAYRDVDSDIRMRRNKIACVLGIILMPIGAFLDQSLYPDLFWEFLIIRIIVVSILSALYFIHSTEIGKENAILLGMVWPVTINLSFCLMMYYSEGVLSRYHTLLGLMILSGGILLPWTAKETLFVSITTLFLYFSSCLLHGFFIDPIEEWNMLFNNGYFIILSGIIATTSSYFNSKARFNDFFLNHELDLRNKELEQLDRLKSSFFANISHELRTPLTLILAPLQDLLQKPNILTDNVANLLYTARDNTLRLLKLVNELLEVIRLEEGESKLNIEPIEVNSFIAAIIDSMIPMANSRGINIEKNIPKERMVIRADSYSLERIFLNLLSNAIKFTPAEGNVIVNTSRKDDNVTITIIDTGIGISEQDIPYIFNRFHQADNSNTRRYQGTGLGLALVKELTEKMDGRITVESQPSIGTRMELNFPSTTGQYAKGEITSLPMESVIQDELHYTAEYRTSIPVDTPYADYESELPPGEGPCVLVVDDEPDMRRYLVNVLEKDYRIIQARDGIQALKAARSHHPDLIVLDLMLPEIDGLEVCKQLKQDADTSVIKIILLTARIDENAKITALKNGADDFLTKPFSRIEIQTRLNNLLNTARLEHDLRQRNQKLEQTLSELKQTQSLLFQSEKLNALGTLTAGLLHEINNPLNYSLTALQSIKYVPDVKNNEDLLEIVDDINDGMGRIHNIVNDLHTFAHPSTMDNHKPFLFSDALKSALRFTAHEHKDIKIDMELDQNDGVIGSQGHIVQVLINLLSNSFAAIKNLGKERDGTVLISSKRNADKLHIKVRDNGPGIAPEVLNNIFEPFFTTGDVGEGMGLGLSISHSIIKRHGSDLEVESEQGKWTEFKFDLHLMS